MTSGFQRTCALILIFAVTVVACKLEAKPADITPQDVTEKMQEIMKAHVTYKKLNPLLARRSLENFIEAFDPMRIYFLQDEVERWLEPEDHERAFFSQLSRSVSTAGTPYLSKIAHFFSSDESRTPDQSPSAVISG